MSNDALAFKLPFRSDEPGIGFVNIPPLPDFPAGLGQIHLLRRSMDLSRWDRVTLQQKDLVQDGELVFDDSSILADSGDALLDIPTELNWGSGFTICVAYQTTQTESRQNAVISTANQQSGSEARGLYLLETWDGSSHNIFTWLAPGEDQGVASFSSDFTGAIGDAVGKFVLLFLRFDGSQTVDVDFPHAQQNRNASASGDSGATPDPSSPMRLFSRSDASGSGDPDDRRIAAYARWDRRINDAEVSEAYAKLKEWLVLKDVDVA